MKLQKWCLPLLSLEKVPAGSWLSSNHFKISKWVSLAYGLGTLQILALALALSTNWSLHKPFKSSSSIPYSSMVLLDLVPIDFQNQAFEGEGAYLSSARLKGEGAWCGVQSLHFSGEISIFWGSLLIVGHCFWGGVPGETMSLPLLPISMCLFYGGTVHLVLRSFSEEIYSICSCKFITYERRWVQDLPMLTSWTPLSMQEFIAMNFHLRTVFVASHTFWYVVFPFLFFSQGFSNFSFDFFFDPLIVQ